MPNPFLKAVIATAACATLVACGSSTPSGNTGGGDSGSGSSWARTSEFTNNYGLDLINAEALYARQATGEGMTVAIIDSGLDMDHREFSGRVSGLSYDVTRNALLTGDYDTTDSHGTAVAGVIGANFGTGQVQGVAYGSTILAINTYTDEFDGYYRNDHVAEGIRYAVDNGADVINISLGGGSSSSRINSALRYAADNGVAVVIATGNSSDRDFGIVADIADPAYQAGGSEYDGLVVAVGSVDQTGDVSGFSSACNARDARFCLVAPGEAITTTVDGGGYADLFGTSFSAPHVAGAIALLMSAYPNLTTEQAVQIILETAYDRGSSTRSFDDTDSDYGNGLLDLEAAMGPSGSLSLTANDVTQQSDLGNSSMQMSTAFGDSFDNERAFANVVLFDDYDREFRSDISGLIASSQKQIETAVFTDFGPETETTRAEFGSTLATLNFDTVIDDYDGRETKEIVSFSTSSKINAGSTLGFSYGGNNTKDIEFGFLSDATKTYALTDAALTPYAFLTQDGQAVSISKQTKGWNLSYGLRSAQEDQSNRFAFDIKADKYFDAGAYLGMRGSVFYEDGSFLGSTGRGQFDSGYKATTTAITVAAGKQIEDLTLFGQVSIGQTRVDAAQDAVLSGFSTIGSQSAMLGMSYQNLFNDRDSLSLTASRPLVVTSGRAQLNATIAEDGSEQVATRTDLSLRPSGAQTNFELGYRSTTPYGAIWGLGLAYIINPNHDATADAQIAAGITFKRRF